MKSSSTILYFSLALVLGLCSCSKQNHNVIYQDGREWVYDVKVYDKDEVLIDECNLTLSIGDANVASVLSGQKGITYTYSNCSDNKTYKETTGVEEDETHVFIHTPRLGMFAFTEVLPFPSITLPASTMTSSEVELHVIKSAYKPAQNKTIKQTLERTITDTLRINEEAELCYVLEGKNTSHIDELGQFESTYWFSNKYGFARLVYVKPDGTRVDIMLKSTNYTSEL